MPEVELSAGVIEYEDTGGEGPRLVLVHGLSDSRHWRKVVPELSAEYRCVAPTLPLGSHLRPMKPDADLSLRGVGRILAEFIERLGLEDVTLCFNDWSGAQTMIADDLMGRVGRLVLVSCETAGNYPPGLGGHAVWLSAKLPGGISLMRQVLLCPRLRRLPFVYGQMSKRGLPDGLMREWLEPLKRPEIRRDLRKYAGDAMNGKRAIRAASTSLASFTRPVLVVWDAEGKMMPNEEGRRLAEAFPDSRLVELPDCYTLIPEDQPGALAEAIQEFLRETA
ncbi:MAG TPA: alpha/beta hydrolase [Solirubrobacterales bacterium]|nr:alpha/beta hydrolase [Solirubrobacterales bacterium]